MKDTQRSKVYRAENTSTVKINTNDMTLLECEELINKLQKKYMKVITNKITVECLRESKMAYYSSQEIKISLPSWSRNRYNILHEFAHYLTDMIRLQFQPRFGYSHKVKIKLPKNIHEVCKTDSNYFSGHGPVFTYVLLMLVRKELGAIQYEKLKNSMYWYNVKSINSAGKVVKIRASKE